MGFWGTDLYENDFCCDVRDCYIDLINKSNTAGAEVDNIVIDNFKDSFNTDEEPLFWYALADTQLSCGRLEPRIKQEALNRIANEGGSTLWHGLQKKKWLCMLEDLKNRLLSDMPKSKENNIVSEHVTNPWEIGDVYAYQCHKRYSKEYGLYGKYFVIQKIANEEYIDCEPISRIQVFNKVYSEVPKLEDVLHEKVLPLDNPERFIRDDSNPDSLPIVLNTCVIVYKKEDYPEEHLHYIGNAKDNEYSAFVKDKYDDCFWASIEDYICDCYRSWENYEYKITDGNIIIL